MKKTRFLYVVLLTLCVSFAFTGCGSQQSGNQQSDSESAGGSKSWEGTEEGAAISFETIDLDGNPVRSEDLFARNKVTMINIWGTTCGPCINEMPVLEEMNKEFKEKGGAIVGLVDDVRPNDTTYLEDAQSIVKDTGVTYTNLCAWDGYDDILACIGTPTTYFVDSKGRIIGEAVLGAYPEKYREFMEAYLAQAE